MAFFSNFNESAASIKQSPLFQNVFSEQPFQVKLPKIPPIKVTTNRNGEHPAGSIGHKRIHIFLPVTANKRGKEIVPSQKTCGSHIPLSKVRIHRFQAKCISSFDIYRLSKSSRLQCRKLYRQSALKTPLPIIRLSRAKNNAPSK